MGTSRTVSAFAASATPVLPSTPAGTAVESRFGRYTLVRLARGGTAAVVRDADGDEFVTPTYRLSVLPA